MNTPRVRVRPVGDAAVLCDFPEQPDSSWSLVRALDRALQRGAPSGVVETCPALVNLLVRFDPLATDHDTVGAAIEQIVLDEASPPAITTHVLEVDYGGELGFDLDRVAAMTEMTPHQVLDQHSGGEYVVKMYGFAPGYAYLGGLPEPLHLPRKTSPVRDVAAGSVLIARDQCLVSTITMPTGWWVIGNVRDAILTPFGERPARFDVGDHVSFCPRTARP